MLPHFLTNYSIIMHKLSKPIFLIVVLVLIAVFYFEYFEKVNNLNEIDNVASKVVTETKEITKLESVKSETKLPINKDRNESIKELPLIYSSSEVLNAYTILRKYELCVQLLDEQIRNYYSHNKSDKQKARKEKSTESCEQVNRDNPEFKLNDRESYYNQFKNLKGDNYLEKVLTREIKFESKEDYMRFLDELSEAPKELFSNIQVGFLIGDYHMKWSWNEAAKRLKTQDLGYAASLLNIAQTYYNCQISNGCGKDSVTMYYNCMTLEEACDLNNFEEYYEMTLTEGQIKDMFILLTYIEELFSNPI